MFTSLSTSSMLSGNWLLSKGSAKGARGVRGRGKAGASGTASGGVRVRGAPSSGMFMVGVRRWPIKREGESPVVESSPNPKGVLQCAPAYNSDSCCLLGSRALPVKIGRRGTGSAMSVIAHEFEAPPLMPPLRRAVYTAVARVFFYQQEPGPSPRALLGNRLGTRPAAASARLAEARASAKHLRGRPARGSSSSSSGGSHGGAGVLPIPDAKVWPDPGRRGRGRCERGQRRVDGRRHRPGQPERCGPRGSGRNAAALMPRPLTRCAALQGASSTTSTWTSTGLSTSAPTRRMRRCRRPRTRCACRCSATSTVRHPTPQPRAARPCCFRSSPSASAHLVPLVAPSSANALPSARSKRRSSLRISQGSSISSGRASSSSSGWTASPPVRR